MDTQMKLIEVLINKLNEPYAPDVKFLEGYIYKQTDNNFI